MNFYTFIQDLMLEIYPIIFILGTLGNFLSFLTLSRKKFKHSIFETYFRIVNFTDTITLLYTICQYMYNKFGINVNALNKILCYYLDYIIYFVPPISAWILVLISFDRMLNINYPNEFITIRNSKKIQYGICLLITITNSIYYLPMRIYKVFDVSINFNNQTNRSEIVSSCVLFDNGITFWMDLFNSTMIPFGLMITFNLITINKLFNSKIMLYNSIGKREIKFAITSITLNICFFIFMFPLEIFFIITIYVSLSKDVSSFFNIFVIFLYSLNFGIMFYVNIFVNSIFRKEFLKMTDEFKQLISILIKSK
jgi:hypothetical protein